MPFALKSSSHAAVPSKLKRSIINCGGCSPVRPQAWSLLHTFSPLIRCLKTHAKTNPCKGHGDNGENMLIPLHLLPQRRDWSLILNAGWNEHTANNEFSATGFSVVPTEGAAVPSGSYRTLQGCLNLIHNFLQYIYSRVSLHGRKLYIPPLVYKNHQ